MRVVCTFVSQQSLETNTLLHCSSEPDISPFTAPGFGRGRGVAGLIPNEPSISRGRGALRVMYGKLRWSLHECCNFANVIQ